MRPTRYATAALLLVAFGAVACSKGDETGTKTAPNAAQAKLPADTKAPGGTTSDAGEDDPVPVTQKATGSFADGEAAYRAKKYDEAMAIFAGYTERRPGNAWGHYMLALSAWKSGDAKKAESAFEKALSIDPRHVKSLVNLSRVFIERWQEKSIPSRRRCSACSAASTTHNAARMTRCRRTAARSN